MKDKYLEQQSDWRYCRVRAGEKKPYPADWQNNPLHLQEVDSTNIGLILGPKGLGVCAIDFDGTTAWTWADAHGITGNDLNTVTWTSGKEDRCQMAFSVPQELWDVLKTKKVITKQPSSIGSGDGEGFEFRWAGGQSVLPPSIHPMTNKPYYWIVEPQGTLPTIPDNILAAWLNEINKEIARPEDTTPEVSLDDLTDTDIKEVDDALQLLKNKYPALSYDDWFRIASAVAHQLGRGAAKALMSKYYPERQRNEYDMLYSSWNKAKSPTIGSLMFMAGVKKADTGNDAAKRFMREQNRFKGLL